MVVNYNLACLKNFNYGNISYISHIKGLIMNVDDMVTMEMFPKQIEMLKAAMKISSQAQVAQIAAGLIGDSQFIEDTAEISDIAKSLCENIL